LTLKKHPIHKKADRVIEARIINTGKMPANVCGNFVFLKAGEQNNPDDVEILGGYSDAENKENGEAYRKQCKRIDPNDYKFYIVPNIEFDKIREDDIETAFLLIYYETAFPWLGKGYERIYRCSTSNGKFETFEIERVHDYHKDLFDKWFRILRNAPK